MSDLEVSERSVHRYLQTLQVAGFPISYDRQKESYNFIEGYSLRRQDFSVEETLFVALAKKMLSGFGSGMEKGLLSSQHNICILRFQHFRLFTCSSGSENRNNSE
jgi:predicted DNA-binding transcriptional regulator YafY